jgi:hypothetical protein
MNARNRSALFAKLCRVGVAGVVLVGLCTPLVGDGSKSGDKDAPREPAAAKKLTTVEAHFRDDSKLKVALKADERIEMTTPYGKLTIPAAEVRQINFGFHIDAATSERVKSAIAGLGSADFPTREQATAELLELGAYAYPALVQALKHDDKEVARRAEQLVEKLREAIPPEDLERPANDVVLTADCKFTGRIQVDVLKVKTIQFGDQQVRLGDLRSLRSLNAADAELVALPDPGSLMQYQDKIGKTFAFRVTGRVDGAVWGTGMYTPDSSLATAAVHAGAVKANQTGVVKVMIVAPPAAYIGSQQNGVQSQPWNGGFTGAFQFLVSR